MSTVGAVGLFSSVSGCVLSSQIKNIDENKVGGKIPWFHLCKLSLLCLCLFMVLSNMTKKTASFECMFVNVLSHPGGLKVEGVQSGTLDLFS